MATAAPTGASTSKDHVYDYDGLHRVTALRRGELSTGAILDANANHRQNWTLDALGNWSAFKLDGTLSGGGADNDFLDAGDLDQGRSHNLANEIDVDNDHTNAPGASITAAVGANWYDPTYDAAGNMTKAPGVKNPGVSKDALILTYDAWNRVVKVTDNDSPTTLGEYEYDGLNRRIVKTTGGVAYDYYYNEKWQVLEVRKDGDTDPWKQYVWDSTPAGTDLTSLGIKGGRYLDAPAVRYYDADVDGSGIVTHYFTNDANMNVTALLDTSGDVVERYEYDAYGRAHILDADFSSDADQVSDHAQDILFAGYLHDGESGLYHVRHRALHPGLGRWLQRDPLGYVDGMSVYEYGKSNPAGTVDPNGQLAWNCVVCASCFGAGGISCAILCTDGYWDVPGEGFLECMRKCVGPHIPSTSGGWLGFGICTTACWSCPAKIGPRCPD